MKSGAARSESRVESVAVDLEQEIETYKALLPNLIADEGKFALIVGQRLIGTYQSYIDALTAGYESAGVKQFLVKRIARTEPTAHFTRDLTSAN